MASEEYKESEISKIVKRLMDEEGFEFGEAVREAMEQTKNFESKADGGSIGIEVLFTDKMANGGRVPAVSGGFLKLLAEGAAKGKQGIMELVESGKSKFDDFVETQVSKKPSDSFTSQNITADLIDGPITVEKMANLDSKTLNIIKNTYDQGLYKEMPEILKAGNLLERFTKVVKGERIIDYERAEAILGVSLKGDETLNDLFKIEFNTRPAEKLADGGRVGLFMGGPALEGQALSIYNSMNMTGATDKEIADRLTSLGLYDPNASTPDTPDTTPGQTIGYQGGNDSPYAGQVVDQTDYGFNKKNYAPGEKLEINPAAFGMSFPAQPSGPKREGIINQAIDSFTSLPTRSLSSFASPTTGGNIVGPAEQGFMEQTLDIDPAGRTREEIRSLYDNYNRFFGRTSNFADARQKGKAGQLFGNIIGSAGGIPFLGKGIDMLSNLLGPRGDASDRSKFAVDNVGFGQGTGRDEFGVYTGGKTLLGDTTNYGERMANRLNELKSFFADRKIDIDDPDAYDEMKKINSTLAKQVLAYQQRGVVDKINKRARDAVEAQKERQRQIELQKKIEAEASAGKSLSQIGRENFTGEGMAFAPRKDTFTGGKTVKSSSTPGGYYSSPRKDGGLMFADGGLATMFTRRR